MRRALRAALGWIRRHPATVAIVLLVAVVSPLARLGAHRGGRLAALDLTGREARHWWSSATALFAAGNGVALVIVLLAVLVVVGYAESVMGSLRAVAAYVGGGAVASLLGLGIGVLEERYLDFLPLNGAPVDAGTPAAALLCTAMASSAFTNALWRRRIRLLAVFAAVTLFLYAGSANDLFSLLAIPIGFVLGLLFGARPDRRLAGLRVARSSAHERRVLLSTLVAITALGPVVAALFDGGGLLSIYSYVGSDPVVQTEGITCALGSAAATCPDLGQELDALQPAAGLIALLPVVVLLLAAWGILKGRRGALWIAATVNLLVAAGMTALFVVTAEDTVRLVAQLRGGAAAEVWEVFTSSIVAAVVPLAVAVVLVALRRSVRIGATPRARVGFVATVVGAAAVILPVVYAGELAVTDQFSPALDPVGALLSLPLRLLPPTVVPGDVLTAVPQGPVAQALWYLPPVAFWAVAVVATARLVLSGAAVPGSTDRLRARALLETGGGDSLSFMTTWPGSDYWFADGVDAGFAYRVRGTVAVTLGGPFGPDRADPAVLLGFARHCTDHGWTPVFYSVADHEAPWDVLGWPRLPVAEEAVLDPRDWSTAGKRRQDIRTATNRAAREGVTARWTRWADLSLREQEQVREISEQWVADRDLPEMGFTLGGIDELQDAAVRLMLATGPDGRVQAVTSWLPWHAAAGDTDGWTLDFMRRLPGAMNGVMEFVLGAVAEQLKADGVARMSLSGSPLAIGDAPPTAATAVLERIGRILEPAYGFRSLLAFKRKFGADPMTLWAVYPDATVLPAFGIALARCYLPDLRLADAARMASTLRQSPKAPGKEQPAKAPAKEQPAREQPAKAAAAEVSDPAPSGRR